MTRERVLPGGFRYEPTRSAADASHQVEKVIDRALLHAVIHLTPGYTTLGGIPRAKTAKQRQIEEAELTILLRMMVNDLGIRTGRGGYTEVALFFALYELGVERGVIAKHEGEAPLYRVRDPHANWSLRAVMSDERKDRERPGRQQVARP
jgi:hypothetical protein